MLPMAANRLTLSIGARKGPVAHSGDIVAIAWSACMLGRRHGPQPGGAGGLGNMRFARIAEVAAAGADYISAGALTHSVPVLDLGMDL